MRSAVALSRALGIEFELEPLDCDPFFHGYGLHCSEAELVVAIWNPPLTDLKGNKFSIPFYLTEGNGILLLGNSVLKDSNILGQEDLLVIPHKILDGTTEDAVLPTYTTESLRTHLHVMPARSSQFSTFFSSHRSFRSSCLSKDEGNERVLGKTAKSFATKLHMYTHLPARDMVQLCRRGNVLTPALKQAIHVAVDKCTSCKTTGRPLASRQVSLSKFLKTFNQEVQVDYMWIKELTQDPILNMKDRATGYCAAVVAPSRDQDVAAKLFELHWVNQHGPPTSVAGEHDFDNDAFRNALALRGTSYLGRPARRHNKTGSVETSNSPLRFMAERLLNDARYNQTRYGTGFTVHEILAKAVYLVNILYGQKRLSSFELAKGYTPLVSGLPQRTIPKDLIDAHDEQIIRRALNKMLTSRNPRTLSEAILKPGRPTYYFEKQTKFGKWRLGFVLSAEEHLVRVSKTKSARGKHLKIAYEDIRLCPESSLLHDLDKIAFQHEEQGSRIEDEPAVRQESNSLTRSTAQPQPPILYNATQTGDATAYEAVLWCTHRRMCTLLSSTRSKTKKRVNDATLDVGNATGTEIPQKDIGDVPLNVAPNTPVELESQEQQILRQLREVIGEEPVSQSRIQFLPQWIIDKAIEKERNNYIEKKAFEPLTYQDLPPNANLITSHCFFQVKYDGSADKLKLKCRLVPHGNKDRDRFNLRTDATTAQFPVIRTLLSAAAILKLHLATIDISGAFLQAGPLTRDVYVRLPQGWGDGNKVVWKLLVPAYGLVESGRLWQLAVEEWMLEHYKVNLVIGLTQLFVVRDNQQEIVLLIAKVVDDFLLAGKRSAIHNFHDAIADRFKVGRFVKNQSLIFNGLHINQTREGSIVIKMQEYLDSIEFIPIERPRRKQSEEKCNEAEVHEFLGLAGKLSWLGHGVLPQAAYAASMLLQLTPDLRGKHLSVANSCLHEIRRLKPTIVYRSLPVRFSGCSYLVFSDASHGSSSYGQTGYLSGVFFNSADGEYHPLDWHSAKQQRVCFSSTRAEILAAAHSADRRSYMVASLQSLFASNATIPLTLTVDSHGLYSTMTTLHEGKDYRLRPTVEKLRDSFESDEIAVVQWVAGTQNIADALTKRNLAMYTTLNGVFTSGRIPRSILRNAQRALKRLNA